MYVAWGYDADVSMVDRDEIVLDAVSFMAARLGTRVSIHVDARSARRDILLARPSILLIEPRHLRCDLAEFVMELQSETDPMGVVLMTSLSADELRATCLPICWQALLHKPFTYNRFAAVLAPLLQDLEHTRRLRPPQV